jgi:hypothetical protein
MARRWGTISRSYVGEIRVTVITWEIELQNGPANTHDILKPSILEIDHHHTSRRPLFLPAIPPFLPDQIHFSQTPPRHLGTPPSPRFNLIFSFPRRFFLQGAEGEDSDRSI